MLHINKRPARRGSHPATRNRHGAHDYVHRLLLSESIADISVLRFSVELPMMTRTFL
jgi:hypothetical protein